MFEQDNLKIFSLNGDSMKKSNRLKIGFLALIKIYLQ